MDILTKKYRVIEAMVFSLTGKRGHPMRTNENDLGLGPIKSILSPILGIYAGKDGLVEKPYTFTYLK